MSIYKKHVFVCTSGKTCAEQDSEDVLKCMRKEISDLGLKSSIRINKSGCLDQCGNGPMVVVYPEGVWYGGVDENGAKKIVEEHLVGGEPVKKYLYKGEGKKK